MNRPADLVYGASGLRNCVGVSWLPFSSEATHPDLPIGKTAKIGDQSELGSITPLILGFFTIAMLLIFLISNVAAAYIERRELTNRVEESLELAAQQIDSFSYYYGGPLTEYLASKEVSSGKLRVPIDCLAARNVFVKSLNATSKKSVQVGRRKSKSLEIRAFDCDGQQIIATVVEEFDLPFQLRALGVTHFANRVKAGATSNYR
jgi:hypothetical protein